METTWYEQAKKKLKDTFGDFKNVKEKHMAPHVRDVLLSFADQNEEFAQAIAQGGDFDKCMAAVAKGVGTHIPDVEAYRKAVQFYFDGATVHMELHLQLEPDAGCEPVPVDTAPAKGRGMTLSLDDFL